MKMFLVLFKIFKNPDLNQTYFFLKSKKKEKETRRKTFGLATFQTLVRTLMGFEIFEVLEVVLDSGGRWNDRYWRAVNGEERGLLWPFW
ncbi:hypothetical protein ES319_D06G226500v1 [Gossypium barbadense]|uniref:Uncharacterized protein n=1 Tax=Gossypium barbadense TaxID=3634 RepID=A0A5J5R6N9_GOSBA|nr:hypothetical protein ES319_D06G226500v1 [Gossypium barbadense]